MRRWILLIATTVIVSGCAPWIGMHNIQLGMSKPEVLQQMGKPNNSSGSGSEEYLWYIPVNRFCPPGQWQSGSLRSTGETG